MNTKLEISSKDKDVLRRLAERKVQIAEGTVNQERRSAWLALDSGENERPMVLAQAGGIKDEKKPFALGSLECEGDWARRIEAGLRVDVIRFEELRDDHVLEPFINVPWQVKTSNYGVEPVVHHGGDENLMGARAWDAPIRDLDKDFDKLHPRTFSVDRESTLLRKECLEDVFNGILPVRIRGDHFWTMGMTWTAIELIGLEGLMISMYDNPDGVHRLMSFLRDDHLAYCQWLEDEGLFTLNNQNDYIGSGSMGYSNDLPKDKVCDGEGAKMKDLWVLLESQETVGVGPDQFEEFVFPYQLRIGEKFGKVYYGCCEPVHTRWHVLKRIPNLSRVSVSPWADQEFMAEALDREYVFSRKPNPTLISTDVFDEKAIRADIRETLEFTRDCRTEIIMKDVHTLNNEPERLARWVKIAREEIESNS